MLYFGTEIKIVIATLGILLSLPIVSIVVIANAGIPQVSDALVTFDPITRLIEIRDPDGSVLATMSAVTSWPTRGYISDEFGTRDSIRARLGLRTHTGIDIATPDGKPGAPVTTFLSGQVSKIRYSSTGYGNHVIIDHSQGISSLYGHLSDIQVVEGQTVEPGLIIGHMGSTGVSTGVHLHFEVRVAGIPVNPRTFLRQ